MHQVAAIFSVQYADPYDQTIEPRNAANMVQAARIEQVIHTSVAGSNFFPRWDNYEYLTRTWDNKYDIQERVVGGQKHISFKVRI